MGFVILLAIAMLLGSLLGGDSAGEVIRQGLGGLAVIIGVIIEWAGTVLSGSG